MFKFNTLVKKLLLNEADNIQDAVSAPDDMGQGTDSGGEQPQQPEQPAQPQQSQPASQAYTYLTKVVWEAFKAPAPIYKKDIQFSDNRAVTTDEAFRYLDIVIRNLQPKTRQIVNQSISNFSKGELDDADIVNFANVALKALFYTHKENSSEYLDIASTPEITPENAKEQFTKIASYLTTT